MTTETSDTINEQITKLDYSSPTQFRFLINQLFKSTILYNWINIYNGLSLNEGSLIILIN